MQAVLSQRLQKAVPSKKRNTIAKKSKLIGFGDNFFQRMEGKKIRGKENHPTVLTGD
jgi:hypothetical protein